MKKKFNKDSCRIEQSTNRNASEASTKKATFSTNICDQDRTRKGDKETLSKQFQNFGNYKIHRQIGSGGFGIVFLATQEKPCHRKVAIKIIKLGMDSEEIIARFEAEEQALALMNHPGIAQIYDSGITDRGMPFFVMEYIEGLDIKSFCDKKKLNISQRLELFIDVCRSVQHAHQKGVIHRDLKPPNILVTKERESDKNIVKVIDFGIAKALHYNLTENTFYTDPNSTIGTSFYMSPEQIQNSRLGIDTRADIYALGVILYELLIGLRPFDFKDPNIIDMKDLRNKICEQEPLKPSKKLLLKTFYPGCSIDNIIKDRSTNRITLEKELKDDLDWIVLKALEKIPEKRYASVSELEADIERHLNGEPVLARAPSQIYKIRKFIHKHKVTVIATMITLSALVIGVIGISVGFSKAITAKNEAKLETEKVRAINDFLQNLLAAPAPDAEGHNVKVIDVLRQASKNVEKNFDEIPEVKAEVHHTLGKTYFTIGDYQNAYQHTKKALDIRVRILGLNHPASLSLMNNIGAIFCEQGNYNEAEAYNRKTIEIAKETLGQNHPDTLMTISNLARSIQLQGRFSEAIGIYKDVWEKQRKILGPEHPKTVLTMIDLAGAFLDSGDNKKAESIYKDGLEIQRRIYGENHPNYLSTQSNIAIALKNQGNVKESIRIYRQVLEKKIQVFGPNHPMTLITMTNLAEALRKHGKYEDAILLLSEALNRKKTTLGENHPGTLGTQINLANVLDDQGKYDKSEEIYREVLIKQKISIGPDNPDTLTTMNNLGVVLNNLKKYEEAESLLLDALKKEILILGPDHPGTLNTMKNLTNSFLGQRKYDKAEKLGRETLEKQKRVIGENHQDTLSTSNNLGIILYAQGKFKESEKIINEVMKKQLHVIGPEHPSTLNTMNNLAVVLCALKKYRKAEAILKKSVNIKMRVLGETHPETLKGIQTLSELLRFQDKKEESRQWLEKTKKIKSQKSNSR